MTNTKYGLDVVTSTRDEQVNDAAIDRQVDLLLTGFALLCGLATVGALRVIRVIWLSIVR